MKVIIGWTGDQFYWLAIALSVDNERSESNVRKNFKQCHFWKLIDMQYSSRIRGFCLFVKSSNPKKAFTRAKKTKINKVLLVMKTLIGNAFETKRNTYKCLST